MNERNYDLDERLIDFAALIINVTETFPKTISGNYLAGQLLKSGTAPALLYGEAHASESRNDFIHKMKITLKQLRESHNSLRIIKKLKWKPKECESMVNEVNQLISVFVKSIKTAQADNLQKEKGPVNKDSSS